MDSMPAMSGDLTIQQARLVLPDRCVTGDLLIRDGTIAAIAPRIAEPEGQVVDGRGLVCLPGAMDANVRFREPGQTHKEDLRTGSRAAASGGVTAFLDMPAEHPSTTTVEALDAKLTLASEVCAVHYGFFMGATGDNLDALLAAERTCGIHVCMGPSGSTLVVDDPQKLEDIFASSNKLVAVHAESARRLAERSALYAESADVADHPRIRDILTALEATRTAVKLAQKHGSRLHLLHLTSEEEAVFLTGIDRERITAEVCIQHLLLDAETAYASLDTLAQCDPPVRSARHRDALWRHLLAGDFDLVATGHAPHTRDEKQRPYPSSPSGMPGIEWMLPLLLDRVNAGLCSLSDVVRWVCEGPARTYRIPRKGRLEVGYDGDVVLVDMNETRTVTDASCRTKAGWSPWSGRSIQGWPVMTAVMGRPVYENGQIVDSVRGSELTYGRNEPGHTRGTDASVRSWHPG